MLKTKASLAALLGGIFLFLFSTPILAGGQLVSLQADTNGWTSDSGYGRVVRLFIGPGFPCKGTEITFKFVDLKDGDYIMTGSGNATYIMQEDRGPAGCGTYAKMATKNSETRFITVSLKNGDRVWDGNNAPTIKVDFDGKYHGDNSYDYYNYRSSIDDPYGGLITNPTPIPFPLPGAPEMVYPKDGQVLDLEGAYMFKVKPVSGASGYLFGLFQDGVMVYENYRDAKTLSSNGEFALWESNPAHAKFHAGEVKVMIRALVNNQWTDAREIIINLKSRKSTASATVLPKPSLQPVLAPTPPAIQPSQQVVVVKDSSASAALQQKIDELQKRLEESQQKQSALELQLNQIINWIKSIFPLFK